MILLAFRSDQDGLGRVSYDKAKKLGTHGLLAVAFAGWLAATAVAEIPANRARQIDEAVPATAQAAPKKPRRVLVFITPPHLMAKDPHKGYCIPYGAYALEALGRKTKAYDAVVSNDLAMFLPDRISQFDAIVLNNTSGAWITPTDEQVIAGPFRQHGSNAAAIETVLRHSLLDFVRNGRGLMAIHYAIGANRQWPEFADLLGAKYDGHPWNEEVGIKLDEPNHPLVAAFEGRSFRLAEEIFQFQTPYSRDNVRVLLSLDTKKTNMNVPWIRRDDNDFALAWVHSVGKGRVFYSAIGHHTELYWNPAMLQFYLGGVQFCTGDLEAPAERLTARASVANETEAGFVSLFNGQDLTGWKGDTSVWSVQDGAITGRTTQDTKLKANNFLIWEGGQPADVEL